MPTPARDRTTPSQRATPTVTRWVDLIACLLRNRGGVSRDYLYRHVPAYARHHRPDAAPSAALEKKFERDKEALRAFGVPIVVRDGRYSLSGSAFYLPYLASMQEGAPPPRKVDREGYRALVEVPVTPAAVELVRRAAARAIAAGDPALAAQVEGALRKLAVDLPEAARPGDEGEVVVAARAAPDPATLPALATALAEHRHVTFTYRSIASDEARTRTVAPYALVPLRGQWYLVGHDASAGALRRFRVTRMRDVRVDETAEAPQYAIPPSFDRARWARVEQPWALGDDAPLPVVFRVARATGAAAGVLDEGEPVEGHADRRRVAVRRPDAFVRWALGFGGAVVPVSPPAIVAAWHDALRAVRARHAGSAA